jgi:hypothetical protein
MRRFLLRFLPGSALALTVVLAAGRASAQSIINGSDQVYGLPEILSETEDDTEHQWILPEGSDLSSIRPLIRGRFSMGLATAPRAAPVQMGARGGDGRPAPPYATAPHDSAGRFAFSLRLAGAAAPRR